MLSPLPSSRISTWTPMPAAVPYSQSFLLLKYSQIKLGRDPVVPPNLVNSEPCHGEKAGRARAVVQCATGTPKPRFILRFAVSAPVVVRTYYTFLFSSAFCVAFALLRKSEMMWRMGASCHARGRGANCSARRALWRTSRVTHCASTSAAKSTPVQFAYGFG